MDNNTCVGKLTKFMAKTLRWGKGEKTTKIQRIMTPDVADGHPMVHVTEEEIYSWREVSEIWDRACLWSFLFVTVFSTIVFMIALAVGGEIQGIR